MKEMGLRLMRPPGRVHRPGGARSVLCAVLLVAMGAFTACGGTTSPSATTAGGEATTSGSGPSGTFTMAAASPPLSLDPAKNSNTVESQYFMDLAYEPLVYLKPDGTLGPGLATSWKYLDDKQRVFQLTLRPEAKFSDGSPVTAKAVVASINHEKTANGPVAVYVNAIKSAKATGPRTVRLDLVRSDPTIAFILTQRFLIGDIVGPKGTANPKILGTTTQGAGKYMLDPAQTVAGDRYTFVPNPHYYDKSKIRFEKFIVRVIKNPQTTLSALQSGQISFATGSFKLAEAAKSAGLQVQSTMASWYGVFLFDRNGEVVEALKSPLVRQALNLATDRPGITKAIFGEYGDPNAQPSVEGYENQGFVPEYKDRYPFDPEKAKALLKEAGYANGFTMSIGASQAFGDGVNMAQAVASDWAKIGVKVNIKQYPDIASIVPPWLAKKLPAVVGGYDAQPMFIFSQQTLGKDAGLFNPWKTEDPELTKLMDAAFATTDEAAQGEAWAAVTKRATDLGWFVPIATGATVYFSAKDVKGVAVSPVAFAQDPTLLHR